MELGLAIAEDAPHFRQKNGQPLYGPDGQSTPFLQRVAATLGNQYSRHMWASHMLEELAQGRWVKNGLMEMLYAHWQSLRHLPTLLDHPSCPKVSPKVGPKAGPNSADSAQRPQ